MKQAIVWKSEECVMMSHNKPCSLLHVRIESSKKSSVSGIYFGVDYYYFDKVVTCIARLSADSWMGLIRPRCDTNLK